MANKKEKTTTKTAKKLPKVTVEKKKKVLLVGSECAPFIATGGLADVLGSLPNALAKRDNYEVSVIIPLYSNIKEEWRKLFKFEGCFNIYLSWREQYVGVFSFERENVKYYFIDNEYYFKRDGNIYGFLDDGERFAFFSKAVIEVIQKFDLYPDVLHCNDWQTAPLIIYLKSMYYKNEYLRRIKTVFTIHNIEYQGVFGTDTYGDLFGFDDKDFSCIELDGAVNLMKGAIEMTDVLSTVSETYAKEIRNPYFAHGLSDIINRNAYKLQGILNGIDVNYYNPKLDDYIFNKYDENSLEGKAICKENLQKMLGLNVKKEVPIIAIISRLVSHKGLDLIKEVFDEILADDVQLVVLGKGDKEYENFFTEKAKNYQGKCSVIIEYNQDLSRKIYSGADIFLMPSKMEPCGLSQMIASRYGTVPIVRETGGLNDSIKAFTGERGNGFTFANYNAHDMLYVIREAIRTYHDKEVWANLIKTVMTTDFSWNLQAEKYEKLYKD